jgi:hypothetical protein
MLETLLPVVKLERYSFLEGLLKRIFYHLNCLMDRVNHVIRRQSSRHRRTTRTQWTKPTTLVRKSSQNKRIVSKMKDEGFAVSSGIVLTVDFSRMLSICQRRNEIVFKFGNLFSGWEMSRLMESSLFENWNKKRCLRGIVGWSTRVGVWLSMKMINDEGSLENWQYESTIQAIATTASYLSLYIYCRFTYYKLDRPTCPFYWL